MRNRQGEVLRRFADTNNDNYVDQWCYFLGGVEVYRDIDSNFNNKADEYRWFNTAGTRWGVDKNEDGHIDSWKVISPHEVAEQIVFALEDRATRPDSNCYLLHARRDRLAGPRSRTSGQRDGQRQSCTGRVLKDDFRAKRLSHRKAAMSTSAAPGRAQFPSARTARPRTLRSATTRAALVQVGDKHEQIFLGTLIAVGNTWKLIDAPAVGSDNQPQEGGLFTQNSQSGGAGGDNGPSNEVTQQMAELEKLDKESDTLPPDQIAANADKRVAVLQKLTEIAPARDRDQWQRQLIDVLSVAIQSGNYPQGH